MDDVLRQLPYASSAPFNSSRRQHEPLCLEGTRVDVLEKIYAWIEGSEGPPLYWLNGMAGTGKSTIARTVARKYYDKGHIIGSFFFSRGSGDAESSVNFCTTIAVQLAARSSGLRQSIRSAVKDDLKISEHAIKDQWDSLVIRPLRHLSSDSGPRSALIVVDALDECSQEENVKTLLQLFTANAEGSSISVRIFLTSRPELPIRHHFRIANPEGHQVLILHNVAPTTVEEDIKSLLIDELSAIRRGRGYDSQWADDQVIDELARHAAGLFIYAATACRYIRHGKRFAKLRLGQILDGSRGIEDGPEQQLDQMYLLVLGNAIPNNFTVAEQDEAYRQLSLVLGALVSLKSNISVKTLSAILDLPIGNIRETLEDLHAVLDIMDGDDGAVHLHHPSFHDFLTDRARCTNERLYVDRRSAHRALLYGCLRIMSRGLRQDICGVLIPATKAPGRIDINSHISSHLKYACLNWIDHAMKCCEDLVDGGTVELFLSKHLLHWLEVLAWLDSFHTTVKPKALHERAAVRPFSDFDARSSAYIIQATKCPNSLNILSNGMDFCELFAFTGGTEFPPQVYLLALIFSPPRSSVRNQVLAEDFSQWLGQSPVSIAIRTLSPPHTFWNPPQLWKFHVTGFRLSADGRCLACVLSPGIVTLYDLTDESRGRRLNLAECISVHQLRISPDCQQFICMYGARATAVDARTGGIQCEIGGDDLQSLGLILHAEYTSDRELFLVRANGTIQRWNTQTGSSVEYVLAGLDTQLPRHTLSSDGTTAPARCQKADWIGRLGAPPAKAVAPWTGRHMRLRVLTHSSDGTMLIVQVGTQGVDIRLWRATSPRDLEQIAQDLLLPYADLSNLRAAISPTKTHLAIAFETEVRLYSFEPLQHVLLHPWRRTRMELAFSPSGRQLAAMSTDDTRGPECILWDVEREVTLSSVTMDVRLRKLEFFRIVQLGQRLLAVVHGEGVLVVFEPEQISYSGCHIFLNAFAITLSADGSLLACLVGEDTEAKRLSLLHLQEWPFLGERDHGGAQGIDEPSPVAQAYISSGPKKFILRSAEDPQGLKYRLDWLTFPRTTDRVWLGVVDGGNFRPRLYMPRTPDIVSVYLPGMVSRYSLDEWRPSLRLDDSHEATWDSLEESPSKRFPINPSTFVSMDDLDRLNSGSMAPCTRAIAEQSGADETNQKNRKDRQKRRLSFEAEDSRLIRRAQFAGRRIRRVEYPSNRARGIDHPSIGEN